MDKLNLKNVPTVRSKVFVHEILSSTNLKIGRDVMSFEKGKKVKRVRWFTKPWLTPRDILVIIIAWRLVILLIDHLKISWR